MNRRKGLAFVLAAALVGLLSACLPRPDEPVDWVRREDAVIVQMKTAGPSHDALVAPEFTLYGDGTLIFTSQTSDGKRLIEGRLPPDAIGDILDFIVDQGFLDFAYDQPTPEGIFDAGTTFLYINTKNGTNAARAYALGREPPEGAGDEWDDFRRLNRIQERLYELDPAAVGGSVEGEFFPDTAVLEVIPVGSTEGNERVPVWPSTVRLSDVAAGSTGGALRIDGETVAQIARTVLGTGQSYREGDRVFLIRYRPVLPFEEHFPEFDQSER